MEPPRDMATRLKDGEEAPKRTKNPNSEAWKKFEEELKGTRRRRFIEQAAAVSVAGVATVGALLAGETLVSILSPQNQETLSQNQISEVYAGGKVELMDPSFTSIDVVSVDPTLNTPTTETTSYEIEDVITANNTEIPEGATGIIVTNPAVNQDLNTGTMFIIIPAMVRQSNGQGKQEILRVPWSPNTSEKMKIVQKGTFKPTKQIRTDDQGEILATALDGTVQIVDQISTPKL